MSDPTIGEVASVFSLAGRDAQRRRGLDLRGHCEACGTIVTPVLEYGVVRGYVCMHHGPLTHDAIVWVYHDISDA